MSLFYMQYKKILAVIIFIFTLFSENLNGRFKNDVGKTCEVRLFLFFRYLLASFHIHVSK